MIAKIGVEEGCEHQQGRRGKWRSSFSILASGSKALQVISNDTSLFKRHNELIVLLGNLSQYSNTVQRE